jgi:hypothetical protein
MAAEKARAVFQFFPEVVNDHGRRGCVKFKLGKVLLAVIAGFKFSALPFRISSNARQYFSPRLLRAVRYLVEEEIMKLPLCR